MSASCSEISNQKIDNRANLKTRHQQSVGATAPPEISKPETQTAPSLQPNPTRASDWFFEILRSRVKAPGRRVSAASHGCETSAARRRMISKNGAATRRASHPRPDFLVTFVSFDKSDSYRQGLASKKGMDAKQER